MSELSNPQGVRQPTVVRPSPEREWLTYSAAPSSHTATPAWGIVMLGTNHSLYGV